MPVLVGLLLTLPMAAPGPPSDEVTTSFLRGRALLRHAVEFAGGLEALANPPVLKVTYRGRLANPYQSFRSAEASGADDARMTLVADLTRERALQTFDQHLVGGLSVRFSIGFEDGIVVTASDHAGTYSTSGGGLDAVIGLPARLAPSLILRRAVRNLPSVRQVGRDPDGEEGRRGVIELSWDERTRLRLAVAATGEVERAEVLLPHPVAGENLLVFSYGDYSRRLGIAFPRRVSVTSSAGVQSEWTLDEVADVEWTPIAQVFSGRGLQAVSAPAPSVVRITDALYEVSGLGGGAYRVPVVVRGDHLVVLDAPLNRPTGALVVRLLRDAFPKKPVRFVVVSHFHADHVGGLGPLVEAGATVVASARDRGYLERVAAARSRLFSLTEGTPAGRLTGLWVDEDLALPGEGVEVKVVHVRQPHADAMLVAVVGRGGAVLNGDLYSELSLPNETFCSFRDWLQSSAADAMVLGVHHAPLTASELSAALEEHCP